ncbi:ABC transporter permease [Porphyromonas pogonae]|uniref:ABC transporter permease n=1 Tax=Porphyromonas pogonae TaxID=867595 RepID=UPI002E7903D4|nr:FtsX-like permease family protein [Porphyromonas pogonae]
MNTLKLTFRRLFRRGEHSISKILSLTLGLSVGLLLLSVVIFEKSYERDYTDNDRIYIIQTSIKKKEEPSREFISTPGAIAPGMKAEVPGVEVATRMTGISAVDAPIFTEDKRQFSGESVLADASFFDIFDTPILIGNPKEVLSTAGRCMISDKLAWLIGGDVVGKQITLLGHLKAPLTIGGVFKTLPKNSMVTGDVLISMKSIGSYTWDGSENWLGNDRYHGFVKLEKGIDPKTLDKPIHDMLMRHVDKELLKQAGVDLTFTLSPITTLRMSEPSIAKTVLILEIVGIALIVLGLLNYILMVTASVVNRRKAIAIQKCYGANTSDVKKAFLSETVLYLIIATLLGLLLVFLLNKPIASLLSQELVNFISWRTGLLIFGILVLVTWLIGWLPARMFSHIPVVQVFRTFSVTGRTWKLSLLGIEFTAITFMIALLMIVSRQYNYMIGQDMGFNPKGVYYISINGLDKKDAKNIYSIFKEQSGVRMVAASTVLPFENQSGDNFVNPDTKEELFNLADLFNVDKDFLPLMEMKIVEGVGFDENSIPDKEMILSRNAADKLARAMGWKDGVVGKTIILTSFGDLKIVGVYDDIILKRSSEGLYPSKMPSAMVYGYNWINYISVRVDEPQKAKTLEALQTIYNKYYEAGNAELKSLEDEMLRCYDASLHFKYIIMSGALVALIISLIGLIGYTNNEINRRRKELAIRKINGAGVLDILRLFILDMYKLAIPSVVLGLVMAYFISTKWLENFSYKAPLQAGIFVLAACVVLLIITLTVVINTISIARQNPIKSIQYE